MAELHASLTLRDFDVLLLKYLTELMFQVSFLFDDASVISCEGTLDCSIHPLQIRRRYVDYRSQVSFIIFILIFGTLIDF